MKKYIFAMTVFCLFTNAVLANVVKTVHVRASIQINDDLDTYMGENVEHAIRRQYNLNPTDTVEILQVKNKSQIPETRQ